MAMQNPAQAIRVQQPENVGRAGPSICMPKIMLCFSKLKGVGCEHQ